MTRRLFLPATVVAALAVLATVRPAAAQNRCLSCTTSSSGGTLKCDVNQTTTGYTTCSCPCECEGACNQGVTFQFEEVLARPALLAATGSPVVDLGREGERALEEGVIFRALPEMRFFFAGREAGLVRYPDGSWRAFPLESASSFVVRTCDGRFVGRVHRMDAPASIAQVLNSIS
jgi:hypothetical protein